MENKELLETLLVAQVLTLAKTIENTKGGYKSDHFVGDAVKEIAQQRASILQALAQTR
jgi:hypothetical protein